MFLELEVGERDLLIELLRERLACTPQDNHDVPPELRPEGTEKEILERLLHRLCESYYDVLA